MATIRTFRPACEVLKGNHQILRLSKQAPALFIQQTMGYPTDKHYNPKFRKERGEKVFKIQLPDFEAIRQRRSKLLSMTPDKLRIMYKKEGIEPYRIDQDKTLDIDSTGEVMDEFIPPEGDGKSSFLSGKYGTMMNKLKMKGKSLKHVRALKKYEDDFKAEEFAQQALEIFIESQNLLQDFKKNKDRLHNLVTELAYPKMTFGLEYKTFRWKYIESIEPPTVVHVRVAQILTKDNLCAQVTVRFHSKQILAVYDRFGRLMYGNENIAKDVLEYVVFEKHIVDYYGKWRVHAKIIPSWLPTPEPVIKTYRKPNLPEIPEDRQKSKEKIVKEFDEDEEDAEEKSAINK